MRSHTIWEGYSTGRCIVERPFGDDGTCWPPACLLAVPVAFAPSGPHSGPSASHPGRTSSPRSGSRYRTDGRSEFGMSCSYPFADAGHGVLAHGGSRDGPVQGRCIESLAVSSGTELSDIVRPEQADRLCPHARRQGARRGHEPKECSAMNVHVACDLRRAISWHFWSRPGLGAHTNSIRRSRNQWLPRTMITPNST